MDALKRIVRLTLALAMVVSLALPATAAKRKAPKKLTKCGGGWTADATCTFRYLGGSLSAGGGFSAAQAGYVTVLLEAIDADTGQRVPVLTCTVGGTSFGGCVTTSTSSPTIELERGQKLFCSVRGADAGKYRCDSRRT